jgi:hypothetical protein
LQCLDPTATLDFSDLDLKSWIDRHVLPLVVSVDGYQILQEGHPIQTSGTSAKAPTALAGHAPFAAILNLEQARKATKEAGLDADYVAKQILPAAQKIAGSCGADILTDSAMASDAAAAARVQLRIATEDQAANGNTLTDKGIIAVQAAVDAATMAFQIAQDSFKTLNDKKICPLPPKAAPKTSPLDTVSASYTFNVTANAGIAPSWTLVRVTGPSGTGSAASTAGAWTNSLSLILAPALQSNPNQDVNYQRLIEALRPPPIPTVAPPF